ncbi:MAG: 30S ribosomal protein S12 methylthiotransferase RimO [Actinomycetes bacterium]
MALVTLGCVRNEVDSEELAGRLEAAGWRLVDDAAQADVAVVNTCGFVEQAKKDSIDALLEAAELKTQAGSGARTRAVVAVGCLGERYGTELAESLPEADAVLGFDSYPDMALRLESVLAGHAPASHVPRDRRTLLPLTPVARQHAAPSIAVPGHARFADADADADADAGAGSGRPASGPPVVRRRLDGGPWAPLKLASGCDRRCTFCAIPSFRGAYLSRPPAEVLAEARWLAALGVRELFLVSENSTSYGKDLGDLRSLETLLPQLADVPGIDRVRVSYLQPAEIRPGLLEAIAATDGVAPYFDLSFQHSSAAVLRRMRRFGSSEHFLDLVARIRAIAPSAGIRSNVIVGFPGETPDDFAELLAFLEAAELDVVGVFGYSDEEGTEAAGLDGKHDAAEIEARRREATVLVEELTAQRAEARVGETVAVLVEDTDEVGAVGRAAHQGPDVDGVTRLTRPAPVGDLVLARVVHAEGVDLVAEPA